MPTPRSQALQRLRQEHCQVAAQAVMAGTQEYRVNAAIAQVTGRDNGVVSIRVGRVLIYLEDREALVAWTRAIHQAEDLQDAAFGPELPPAAYQPRAA